MWIKIEFIVYLNSKNLYEWNQFYHLISKWNFVFVRSERFLYNTIVWNLWRFTIVLLRLLEEKNFLNLPAFSFFFFSTTFPEFREFGAKSILQTIEQLIQSVIFCYKRKSFWRILFLIKSQRRGNPQRLLVYLRASK